MTIKIYFDSANLDSIREAKKNPKVEGFTTNPSILRKDGVTDYEAFAKNALQIVEGLPISFEVFSDDLFEMHRQAKIIAGWAPNVAVKIPVTNTKKESTAGVIRSLANDGVLVNVTAIFTLKQLRHVQAVLEGSMAIFSIFAGRIADTGVNPMPLMRKASKETEHQNILWASPREVYNVVQAEECGCDIITLPPDLLKKMEGFGKDLMEFSLQTVQMFYDDSRKAGYSL